MRADKRKEGRQETAPAPTIALDYQVTELGQFKRQKSYPQQGGDAKPDQDLLFSVTVGRQHRQAGGETARQKYQRFGQNERHAEQFPTAWSAIDVIVQHGISRKQGGKQHAVGHEVYPEAKQGFRGGLVVGVVVDGRNGYEFGHA